MGTHLFGSPCTSEQ